MSATVAEVAHVWQYDMAPDRWLCLMHDAYSDDCPLGEMLNEWMPQ